MSRESDSVEVYNLLLGRLKEGLSEPILNVQVLKIALDFIKTFNLNEEVKEETKLKGKSVEEFIQGLPFK